MEKMGGRERTLYDLVMNLICDGKMAKLPLGKIKKILDEEVIAILKKYGVEI